MSWKKPIWTDKEKLMEEMVKNYIDYQVVCTGMSCLNGPIKTGSKDESKWNAKVSVTCSCNGIKIQMINKRKKEKGLKMGHVEFTT